jgi:hypothetical protein
MVLYIVPTTRFKKMKAEMVKQLLIARASIIDALGTEAGG